MALRLVFLGPPGAGKGTQAKVICRQLRIPHISTGDILRDAVKRKTPVGLKAKAYMDRGELVPDEIITEVVAARLEESDSAAGFVLDGFPRTRPQAEALDGILKRKERRLDLVLYFATSEPVVIERLAGRRICPVCGANYHVRNIPPQTPGKCDQCGNALVQRPDDKPETIRRRLRVYAEETADLVDYYRRQGVLREVSGDLDVDGLNETLKRLFVREKLIPDAGQRR